MLRKDMRSAAQDIRGIHAWVSGGKYGSARMNYAMHSKAAGRTSAPHHFSPQLFERNAEKTLRQLSLLPITQSLS